MSKQERILYQNSQWKLMISGNTAFIEAKHPYPYWRYVNDISSDPHLLEHIGEKTWCDIDALIDVCFQAVKVLMLSPVYDLDEASRQAKKSRCIRDHQHP